MDAAVDGVGCGLRLVRLVTLDALDGAGAELDTTLGVFSYGLYDTTGLDRGASER